MTEKTYILTAHEEAYSDSTYTIGVLLNHNQNGDRVDSLVYLYRDTAYIFFNTIIDMIDYLVFNDKRINRAYLIESEFDDYYDKTIDGKFADKLNWVSD